MRKLLSIGIVTCFVLWMNPIHLLAMEGGAVSGISVQNGKSIVINKPLYNRLLLADQAITTSESKSSSDAIEPQTDSATQASTPNEAGTAVDGSKKHPTKSVSGKTDITLKTEKTDSKKVARSSTPKTPHTGARSLTDAPVNHNSLKIENILLHIGTWWVSNPYNLQIWYIFSFIGLIFYLLRLKNFRRPLLFLSIIILGFYLGNSLDPISAIFNLIPKTNFTFSGALIILAIMVILSLFLGRFYCGWICPLGAIQELIYPKTKIKISSAPDSVLKYLKYLILVVFLYIAWRTGNNLWDHYGPLKVLVHFNGTELAIFFLLLTMIVSLLIERPICRYICPLGAIFALTSRLAILKMRADAGTCMVCGKCTSGDCPMNGIEAINTITDLPKVDNSECICCLRCQDFCQREALHVSIRRIDKVSG